MIEIRALTCQRRSFLAVGAECSLGRRWRRYFAWKGFCGRRFGHGFPLFLVRGCLPTPARSFQPCDLLFQHLSHRCSLKRLWKLLWTSFGLWLLAINLFGGAVLEAPLAPLIAAERASKFQAHASPGIAIINGGAQIEAAECGLLNGCQYQEWAVWRWFMFRMSQCGVVWALTRLKG